MKLLRHLLLLAVPVLSLQAAEIAVFAASSLTDALRDLAPAYEALSGDKLRLTFDASSTLARQIRTGAPADVFLSADEAKMDELARYDLLLPKTRVTLLSNTLVIVVSAKDGAAVAGPADLSTALVHRLALAETQSVPAGIYAREYLEKIGLWDKVRAKVLPAEHVRAALAAVESGKADAAIVYRTDALASKGVSIAFAIPARDGPRISYPLAVIKESRQPEAARRFTEFLATAEARAVFRKHGFLPAGL